MTVGILSDLKDQAEARISIYDRYGKMLAFINRVVWAGMALTMVLLCQQMTIGLEWSTSTKKASQKSLPQISL